MSPYARAPGRDRDLPGAGEFHAITRTSAGGGGGVWAGGGRRVIHPAGQQAQGLLGRGAGLGGVQALVREGKVRFIGSSTFPAELTVQAQWAAEQGGHHRFRSEQPRYSILTRIIEGHVLPTAQRYGMGVLTYGPLSSGWLSGRPDPTRPRATGWPRPRRRSTWPSRPTRSGRKPSGS
ncbi:MAG: aldo/keto reductase [Streptosporangiaceae bacterium]